MFPKADVHNRSVDSDRAKFMTKQIRRSSIESTGLNLRLLLKTKLNLQNVT